MSSTRPLYQLNYHSLKISSGCLKLLVLGMATIALGFQMGSGVPVPPQPGMGDPLLGLTPGEMILFDAGKIQFTRNFTAAEGLGPIFNKESCGNCHNNPVGGPGSQTVTRAGISGKAGFDPLAALGGSLFQQQAISIDCAEVVPAAATVTAFRVTNSALGAGLVEAIPDPAILALEDPTDTNGDGISGRAHMVNPVEAPMTTRVGRFGWKGGVATVLSFSADAALNEVGITNMFFPNDNDPNGVNPPDLATCDTVADPEDQMDGGGFFYIERVTHFQRFLAAPPQTPKSGMTGEAVFNSVGCNLCHVSSYTTSSDPLLETALRNQPIQPYSDYLLHDMGLAADFIQDGAAGERELRTPSLWGLRTRDPLWHDGRFGGNTFANRVNLAIQEHGLFLSEAVGVTTAYNALSAADQNALIAFLDSLGRREFDGNGDDVIDLADFLDFNACFTGPIPTYTPDDPCSVHDIDQDGDVDLADFDSFLLAFSGPLLDCNGNTIPDLSEILQGTVADVNANGIPDVCECFSDITPPGGNGVVNIDDLVAILNGFGPCPAPPALCGEDITPIGGNGVVNIDDLVAVLNAFGPCP